MKSRFFTEDEMRCKGTGQCFMSDEFMTRLDQLREAYGKPIIVTSGYRSPQYNMEVSSSGAAGPHTTGRAVDIAVRGADAVRLVHIALGLGFTGVGVSQKGDKRFIHLDDLEDGRPMIWSY